jgi:D-aminoacyl-tRNA deacylase
MARQILGDVGMRVVVQRVSKASVTVAGEVCGQIGAGLLLLVGVEEVDGQQDIDWLVRKISQLRIFNDAAGVMNLSLLECGGEVLAVSQFTLFASTRKGNRPSYSRAARGDISRPLFEQFVDSLSQVLGRAVPTGVFGADMQVELVNDGPVTILLDSRDPE